MTFLYGPTVNKGIFGIFKNQNYKKKKEKRKEMRCLVPSKQEVDAHHKV